MNRNAFRFAIGLALFSIVSIVLLWRDYTSLDSILNRLSLGMSINEVLTKIPKRNLDGHCVPLDIKYASADNNPPSDNIDGLYFWQTIQNRTGSTKDHLLFNSKLELCYIPKRHQKETSKGYPEYSLEVFTVSVETNSVLPGIVHSKEIMLCVSVWSDGLCDVSFPHQVESFTCVLPENLLRDSNFANLKKRREVDFAQIRNLSSVEKMVLSYLSSNTNPLGLNESKGAYESNQAVLSMIHAEVDNDVQHQ